MSGLEERAAAYADRVFHDPLAELPPHAPRSSELKKRLVAEYFQHLADHPPPLPDSKAVAALNFDAARGELHLLGFKGETLFVLRGIEAETGADWRKRLATEQGDLTMARQFVRANALEAMPPATPKAEGLRSWKERLIGALGLSGA